MICSEKELENNDIIDGLLTKPLSSDIKIYLEKYRGINVIKATDGHEYAKFFQKKTCLQKLCQVIVYRKEKLDEKEKEYFLLYLSEALENGFSAKDIGLSDRVLAKLAAEKAISVEAVDYQDRNERIWKLALRLENGTDFFEETAAKIICFDPNKEAILVPHCLELAEKCAHPRGIVFALALVNIGKIDEALKILEILAQKGCATEMTTYLYRLLAQIGNCQEKVVNILKLNLAQLKRSKWYENIALREYVVKVYLKAVEEFICAKFFTESCDILVYLAENNWFDGLDWVKEKIKDIANMLLVADKELSSNLLNLAHFLKLQVVNEGEAVYIGKSGDVSLAIARQHLEQAIKYASPMDLSKIIKELSKTELSINGNSQNVKKELSLEQQKMGNSLATDIYHNAEVKTRQDDENETVVEKVAKAFVSIKNKTNLNNILNGKINLLDKFSNSFEKPSMVNEDNDVPIKPNIEAWNEENDLHKGIEENNDKLHINNILNIKIKDIDEHFEKIKDITTAALKNTEEQTKKITEQVGKNSNIMGQKLANTFKKLKKAHNVSSSDNNKNEQ